MLTKYQLSASPIETVRKVANFWYKTSTQKCKIYLVPVTDLLPICPILH